jgi:hypothetical protein
MDYARALRCFGAAKTTKFKSRDVRRKDEEANVHLAALALGLAALVPACVASFTNAITSGAGEVSLGPIVVPNAATRCTVTWTYNGGDDVSQSISSPVVDVHTFRLG